MRRFVASLFRVVLAIGFLAGATADLAWAATLPHAAAMPHAAPVGGHAGQVGHCPEQPAQDMPGHPHDRSVVPPCCVAIGATAPALPDVLTILPAPSGRGPVVYAALTAPLRDRAIAPPLGPPRFG
ncbi:MAG: hypothetical protein AB7F35_24765 [Acetobacteraceae bacterium]